MSTLSQLPCSPFPVDYWGSNGYYISVSASIWDVVAASCDLISVHSFHLFSRPRASVLVSYSAKFLSFLYICVLHFLNVFTSVSGLWCICQTGSIHVPWQDENQIVRYEETDGFDFFKVCCGQTQEAYRKELRKGQTRVLALSFENIWKICICVSRRRMKNLQKYRPRSRRRSTTETFFESGRAPENCI